MNSAASRRQTPTPASAAGTSLPVVAIVGRPNVGKSTLLNRIVGRREAIVQERPGVTRDRKEVEASWSGRDFVIVDTGGWMSRGSVLDDKVSKQSERAIASADVVILVVDASVGPTDDDEAVARLLRKIGTPVIVVVNKVDDGGREVLMWNFLALGLGDPAAVSALHGRGTGDLLDRVVEHFAPAVEPVEDGDGAAEARPGSMVSRVGSERCSRWRSSAGRTSGSRRCSTGSSARIAPWCTTWPAPPATRSTRS